MRVVVRHPDSHPADPGVIDVWPFRLDVPAAGAADALSAEERTRAARYQIDRARTQFVAGRGMLRAVLGRYLGCPARAVPLTCAAGGKPVLDPAAGAGLHFNLTHSGAVGLIAVAPRPVGVDVEEVRDVPNAAGLVDRFFAAAEREAFARLPADLRPAGFLRGWTCKEALLKAVGRGLQGLESCVVDLDPRTPPRVIRFDPGDWRLAAWEPWPGYVAAVAVESPTPIRLG